MSSAEVPGSTLQPEVMPPTPETESAPEAQDAPEPAHVHTLNPDCTREVEIEVSAEDVSSQFRKVIRRYQKSTRLPGFRAGKVPESLIRSRFGEQIRHDVLDAIVPGQVRAAIAAKNLEPVSQPQATEMDIEDGKPLRFKVVFEVIPEFSVEGYQEVTVEKPDAALTEDEFKEQLDGLRDGQSVMEPVEEDRPLADGDFAMIDYTGRILGKVVNGELEAEEAAESEAPLESKDALVELGSALMPEGFSSGLRGARAGDHRGFEIDYPNDFGGPRLAGKRVAYEADVKGIRKKILPDLDDNFAKEVGGYESYAEFDRQLRERMASAKQRRVENETISRLMDALAARFNFPVPESLIQQQVDRRLDRGLRALASQGMHPDQLRHLDFDRLRAEQREASLSDVKGALVLDRIADMENVQVDESDVTRELEIAARSGRESVEAVRQRLTANDGLARIREQLRREKTGHLLYERLPS